MKIKIDLEELVQNGTIDEQSAERIQSFYNVKISSSPNKTLIAFGIIGALLIGLGIILILAHNWDNFSRLTKTIVSFCPLVISQVLVFFTIMHRPLSEVWRESTSILLFFAVGTCISLISQIYHLPGSIGEFMLTWMLLIVPLVYIVPSRMASLFYIIGITYYACFIGYWSHPTSESLIYFALLLVIIPSYILLIKRSPTSNFTLFHHWLIPVSLTIVMGVICRDFEEGVVLVYFALFGLFLALERESTFKNLSLFTNGYKVIGTIGTTVLLLGLSFNVFWEELKKNNNISTFSFFEIEILVAILLAGIAILLFFIKWKGKVSLNFRIFNIVFILMFPIFILGMYTSWAMPVVNLLTLAIGVAIIRSAARDEHLGMLNFGLFVITALIICRFFDTDLSFILRGVLFVLMGLSFFLANMWIIKKRKAHE